MTIQQKIRKVQQDTGCSPTEACEALGVDIDAATMASLAMDEKCVTLAELCENGKLIGARVLIDVMEDSSAENKDKIAAAKIFLVGAGDLPNLGVNAYEERFKKFLALTDAKVTNVIDVVDNGESVNNRIKNPERMLSMAS